MLLLTQAGWREGTVVIIGMRGKTAVAEAMMLQQPEARCVFSWGSCPWITGPWQWRAAQAPGVCVCVCVDSDLCLHTGFLVAAGAALAFHAYLCGQADSCGLHLSLELV